MCDMVGQYIQKKEEEKQIKEEQAAKTRYWKIPACYDDDDDDENYTIAITPKEPDNSLSMGDEHPDTIPAKESEEFIKFSVENLVSNPSESEGEYECDVPACEDFTTLSNILFDADYDFSSVDDKSFYDEDIPKKIYLNPLFDEEIISIKIDLHHFNAESDLIESLLNHDSSIISSSSKIDSLFDEFVGELTLLKSIPPGINETDCDPEEEIRLIKRLLYDNSSPRPPEEFISINSNTALESFSPFPIPIEDSDFLMEEIDLSFTLDDPMPSGLEEDDYDSEGDILILKEFLSNDSLSLPKNESFHFDIPSSSHPPAKPPDGIPTASDEFPLPEDFPTATEERFPLLRTPCPIKGILSAVGILEVIKFGDSYEAPQDDAATGPASEGSAKKKGRTVAVTTEDIQKKRNDVKTRTTLLLALPDEYQSRFIKYKTAQELWAAILKTFGGNEATKKTKKNQLKLQYGNFKAEGSETLEQTFNRLQAIVSHLEFMDVEIEQDDLNQKFLTSLTPEWLMYTIVWRNRVKNSSGNGKVNTASIPTASTQVSPASANIKHEDINQIDEDDIEKMDIMWNMALLSMSADIFWKKIGKKISIQGTDVAGFDKSKVECFNCYKMGHFARSAGLTGAKTGVEEKTTDKNHALVADEEAPIEFALMAKSSSDNEVEARLVEFKNQEIKFCKKIRGLEFKVESKTNRIESLTNELEKLKKEKEGLDSKLKDDTITDYSRPSPSIKTDSPTVIKTNKDKTVRKPSVKYAEMYRKTSKSSNVRGEIRDDVGRE
nr:hypothetical protein [Tanacetum cinerariifolium]